MCGKILGDSSERRSHTDENHTKSEVSINSEENIGDESVKVCERERERERERGIFQYNDVM